MVFLIPVLPSWEESIAMAIQWSSNKDFYNRTNSRLLLAEVILGTNWNSNCDAVLIQFKDVAEIMPVTQVVPALHKF